MKLLDSQKFISETHCQQELCLSVQQPYSKYLPFLIFPGRENLHEQHYPYRGGNFSFASLLYSSLHVHIPSKSDDHLMIKRLSRVVVCHSRQVSSTITECTIKDARITQISIRRFSARILETMIALLVSSSNGVSWTVLNLFFVTDYFAA